MRAAEMLQHLQRDIHSVVMATVDTRGRPATCVMDVMLADEEGLYFLTAVGKAVYRRLRAAPFVSLTGFTGRDTLSAVSVTVRGPVREVGPGLLPRIFEENPYMAALYPTASSREALTVFVLYAGQGEWMDLSQRPVYREAFAFGGRAVTEAGFAVGEACTGCGRCLSACPQQCIRLETGRAAIQGAHCLHCGRCAQVCPHGAIVRLGGEAE